LNKRKGGAAMFDFKKIDRKGRVIITEQIRKQAKIETGDMLAVYVENGKVIVQKVEEEIIKK
jgi:AbrB family looped-hinge helix DNA binding protein